METIKFSVVIPLYNKSNEIERAISSILRQSYKHYEIIVIDDGSTDDGPKKVEKLAETNPKIKIIFQENVGVSAARNKGINIANNDFIAFLDADDEWNPDFLKTISDLILSFPKAGAYATAYKIVTPDGQETVPKLRGIPDQPWEGLLASYFYTALGEPPVWTSAVVVPKMVLEKVGMFPVGISIAEDKEVWERIALDYEIAFSWYVGATYYQTSGNRLCNLEYGKINDRPFIEYARKRIKHNSINKVILHDLQEYLAFCCLIMAKKYLLYENGDKNLGKIYLKEVYSSSMGIIIQKLILRVLYLLPKKTVISLYKMKNQLGYV